MDPLLIENRRIAARTQGRRHGPITRVVSPSGLGERIKPFVFLDFFDTQAAAEGPRFGIHPHSGIATITVLLEGDLRYEDTTGKAGQDVDWCYTFQGSLRAEGERVPRNELVAFEEGESVLRFEARGDTRFVLGSAVKHPHDLVLGYYSVHTSAEALATGEAGIQRIGEQLRASGRLYTSLGEHARAVFTKRSTNVTQQ